jgi:hypothetical protein
MATAPVLRELNSAFGLAQAGDAARCGRRRCSRAAEGRSQSQEADEYEAFHPKSLLVVFRLCSAARSRRKLHFIEPQTHGRHLLH